MGDALELKAKGNEALKAKNFVQAVAYYTQAIALEPANHVFFSNRSAAYLSMGNAEGALADAEQCVELKPDWPKSHSRKGAALHKLNRLDDARHAYEHGIAICGEDRTLQQALETVDLLINKLERENDEQPVQEDLPADENPPATSTPVENTSTGDEEWRQQSEEYKQQGNQAFKEGNHADAVKYYTNAIELDPENHVLFSNRSAAYLATKNAISKALADAKKCLELKPDWAKGYARKGAAEHALGRYDAAIETFNKGLEIEPTNQSLRDGKTNAKVGAERARQAQIERDRLEREAIERAEAERKKMLEERSDDMLADLFSSIDQEAERRAEEKREMEAKERRERIQEAKTEKFTKQKLGTGEEQISRLMATNHKFKNLNPFLVLQLDIDATTEDIKFRYKKLSVLIHPDKNLGNVHAQEAFDYVKKAHDDLLDSTIRDKAIDLIESTRFNTERERRKLVYKGLKESDLPPLDEALDKAVAKEFADLELRRRDAEKHLAAARKRERDQEEELKQAAKEEETRNKQWVTSERRDHRVADWQKFQGTSKGQAKSLKNWKQETTKKKRKFGEADMESWKKDWK